MFKIKNWYKLELKAPETQMYFIVTVNDNTNGNHRRIILNVKDTKLYVPVVALSAKDNQSYQNFLTKNLKDQIIGVNIKPKSANKITTN